MVRRLFVVLEKVLVSIAMAVSMRSHNIIVQVLCAGGTDDYGTLLTGSCNNWLCSSFCVGRAIDCCRRCGLFAALRLLYTLCVGLM